MQRPRIKPKKTIVDSIIELLSFLLVGASIVVIIVYYSELPEKIGIPFNWPSKSGQGMDGKATLWMTPLICGIIVTVLFTLNRFPWIFNYPVKVTEKNAHSLYRIANQLLRYLSLTVGFMCITFTLQPVIASTGSEVNFLLILSPIFVIILFGLIIFAVIRMMRKTKSE